MDRGFAAPQETLLQRLAEASRLFPPIERSLDAARPESVALDGEEAWRFVSEGAPLLTESGHGVLLPAELSASGQRRLRLRLRGGRPSRGAAGAVTTAAALSMESLLGFQWEVALGDQPLSAKEFQALARMKRPLVEWRGQWVRLDPREMAEIQRLLAREGGGRTLSLTEALAAALGGAAVADALHVPVEVVPEGPLAAIVDRLVVGSEPVPAPAALAATLRPYQSRGLGWLAMMADLGLGGCLADDMGLGKTVQLIAFLLQRRAAHPEDPRPSLVVCPTSVLGNWERELARFAPSLPVARHHGAERARELAAFRALPPGAVVLTTYALLRRDQGVLAEIDWATAVLDEAQNIKNSASAPGAGRAAPAPPAIASPSPARPSRTGSPSCGRSWRSRCPG